MKTQIRCIQISGDRGRRISKIPISSRIKIFESEKKFRWKKGFKMSQNRRGKHIKKKKIHLVICIIDFYFSPSIYSSVSNKES